MISMFFSATAHCTGWPPNVMPCVYIDEPSRNGSIDRGRVAITAPIAAYEEESPFAEVIEVGPDVVALGREPVRRSARSP